MKRQYVYLLTTIVFVLAVVFYVYWNSKKGSPQKIQVYSSNSQISVNPSNVSTLPPTVTEGAQQMTPYTVDPLTAYVNSQIAAVIQEQPAPSNFKITNASSNQTGLDTLGSFTTLRCKNADKGSFINQIDVYSGQYVDGLSIHCSDDITVYPKVGGSGGSLNPIKSLDQGFSRLSIKSGKWVDSITFDPLNGDVVQKRGGSGGGGPFIIDCGVNGKLAGLSGTAGSFINKLEGICITPEY